MSHPALASPGLVLQGVSPPLRLSDFKLIAFDMDSTLINIECVDEIADAVGRKAEVAAITEAAMRGEIADYKDSLRQRVALLKGVSVDSMAQVYMERLLELADGRLTGRMVDQPWGDICDGAEKRRMLLQTCAALGCAPGQSIAVGDGANDLPMMTEAGLSVAYHAKPRVREQAMVAINAGGLDQLLTVFGTP